MGFFIGWRYFDESQRYSDEYYTELSRNNRDQAAAKRKAEKLRLKRQAARRAKKKKLKEQWRQESELYQQQLEEKYGKPKSGISGGTGGPSSAYDEFGKENKEGYRKDIERRYGTLYNSSSAQEAPKINRGLGVEHHQKISRPKDVKHHSPLGPIGAHKKTPVGMKLPGINSDNPNLDLNSNNSNTQNSSSNGKLTRPF